MKTSLGFLIGCCVGGLSGMSQSTESPSVVPVGAFWIESDGLNYAQDGPGTKQLNVAATLFTWGVVENLDVQLEWAGWTRSTAITPTGERETVSGWGDMGIRTKWNFSGDETNESAWAILTSLKIPAASTAAGGNGEWEPGMSLIYGQPLSDGGGGGSRPWWRSMPSPMARRGTTRRGSVPSSMVIRRAGMEKYWLTTSPPPRRTWCRFRRASGLLTKWRPRWLWISKFWRD